MGSKRAHFTCLGTPNGLGSFLEEHIFDPLLTHFLSQNNSFSRHFVTLEGPKWVAMGSKRAHFTCLCTPNSSKVSLEKRIFVPFLTDFWSQNNPFSRHSICDFGVAKMACMGSKRAHFTCLGTPNGLGSFLEGHIFDPLLTHFLSQNNPFSRHFVTLEGPKWLAMGSKRAHFTLLGNPNGLGSFLE